MAVDPMQTNPLVLLVQKARESCAWKRGPPTSDDSAPVGLLPPMP